MYFKYLNSYQVHIGNRVILSEEQWKQILTWTKDSHFIKELATAIWGTSVLQARSVDGRKCPRFKDRDAKPPLTVQKIDAVKGLPITSNFTNINNNL